MIAVYETTIKIQVAHELDSLENLKSDREYAEGICQMIADESTSINGVAVCDIVKSSLSVTEK